MLEELEQADICEGKEWFRQQNAEFPPRCHF